jgi:hypothetical protein
MKVREILEAKGSRVVTIRPDATLSAAVHRLALERIGALVVSDDGLRVAGILSERDVVDGPGARRRRPARDRAARGRPDDPQRRHLRPGRHREVAHGRDDPPPGAPPAGPRRRPASSASSASATW